MNKSHKDPFAKILYNDPPVLPVSVEIAKKIRKEFILLLGEKAYFQDIKMLVEQWVSKGNQMFDCATGREGINELYSLSNAIFGEMIITSEKEVKEALQKKE